jgi:hypothetical protein
MADIKQAAKWLQEGKRVTRSAYPQLEDCPEGTYPATVLWLREDGMIVADDLPCTFGVKGWLADDWKIAP